MGKFQIKLGALFTLLIDCIVCFKAPLSVALFISHNTFVYFANNVNMYRSGIPLKYLGFTR